MKYILKNIDEDDFITEVLSELNCEIRNGDNNDIKVIDTGKSDRKTKGKEIAQLVIEFAEANAPLVENVLGGMIATGLCGMLKAIIRRLKKTPKYIPEKQIEITQEDSEGNRTTVKMTLQELAEKDER